MFSLELRKLTPAPPGVSAALTEATYLFSALKVGEVQKNDEEFLACKEKFRECPDCKQLVLLCGEIFTQKLRVIACLSEMFKLLQKESFQNLELQQELESLKKDMGEEKNSKLKNAVVESKKKDKQIQELLLEIKDLNTNRVYSQHLMGQMQMDIENKNKILKNLPKNSENPSRPCEKCIEKDKAIKEMTYHCQVLTTKLAENIKLLSDRPSDLEKNNLLQALLNAIPEINGRELRISIHKKIIEIETDFNELPANPDNFEIIKMKYLQLPYLLKPIFDLTKQYEKSMVEFGKVLNSN